MEAVFSLDAHDPRRPNDRLVDEPTPDAAESEVAMYALRKQLDEVIAHDAGTRVGDDVEELHDMRVATRRIRAALAIFEAFLPARVRALGPGFRWLGRALGKVRDLDVQLERYRTWESKLPEDLRPGLHGLEAAIEAKRAAARRRMLRALDSRRYEKLIARATEAFSRPPGRSSAAKRVAPRVLEPYLLAMLRRAEKIGPKAPAKKLHKLRIAGKRLRYALEFHRPVYGAVVDETVPRLVDLQDHLGELQDARVAVAEIRAVLDSDRRRLSPEAFFVAGVLVERYERMARKKRRKAGSVVRKATRRCERALRQLHEIAEAETAP